MIKKTLLNCFFFLSLAVLTGCNAELISNITERQANEIVALLETNNIEAQKIRGDKGVFSIRVEKDYMSDSIALLNGYNLPSADKVEVAQAFPANAMVSTPLGEKARLISAIEQRLGQSFLELENVTSSRVHLSYPTKEDSGGEGGISTASVLIIYRNTINEAEYIDKIKRLIKNSMSSISYEDISIVLFRKNNAIRLSQASNMTPEWLYIVIGLLGLVIFVFIVNLFFCFRKGKLAIIKKSSR